MTEQELRDEIERYATPKLRVVQIGRLFCSEMDAIVENETGQFLWSAWRREMRSTLHKHDLPRGGQTSLF